jgi:hypothetical protein
MSTDLEPISVIEVAPRAETGVETLRYWIMQADEMRAELAEAGDYTALAFALARIRELQRDMKMLADSVEVDVARLLPDRRTELTGIGVFEVKRSANRKAWEWGDLLDEVIKLALIDEETGEMPATVGEAAERIRAAVLDVAPLTASQNARVGALKRLGLNVEDFCDVEPGNLRVQIS